MTGMEVTNCFQVGFEVCSYKHGKNSMAKEVIDPRKEAIGIVFFFSLRFCTIALLPTMAKGSRLETELSAVATRAVVVSTPLPIT